MKISRLLAAIARIVMVAGLASCAVPTASAAVPASSPVQGTATPFTDFNPVGIATAAVIPAQPPQSVQNPALLGSGGLLPPQYYSPLKNSQYVSKSTTIAVRYGPTLSAQDITELTFTVTGIESGPHAGQKLLADDQKTVIFKPDQPFTPGEQVQVNVNSLSLPTQAGYIPIAYTFTVAENQQPGGVGAATTPSKNAPQPAFPSDLTVPQDIPHFTVTTPSQDTAEGDIFVAPVPWTSAVTGAYLLILDGQGQLVYYQSMADALNAYDFKVQPNGLLSYFDQKTTTYYVMDSHYQVVNTYQAGNGYATDLHDLLLLPGGNALLMAYDAEQVDMSKVVIGGKTNAMVTGLIVQELDPSKNVIFQWRSWDHVAYTDSTSSLLDPVIDLVHGNGLALANDGNLLLSSRNLSEVTKINLQTGDVMWRLGGKANQFKFVNDQPFAFQHNVSQLPNGDITLMDNHGTQESPADSRGVEYRVDEVNKTVTKVWEYQPSIFATFMGDTQRLADGNTFIDWGAPFTGSNAYQYITMTEVDANNQVIFQLAFDQPYVSYRAFRTPWVGSPLTAPALAFKQDASGLTLGYSWNGATEVAAWRVFGGSSAQSLNQIEEKAKNGFETQSQITNLAKGECYFQVAAVDKNGNEMARSAVVSTDTTTCPLP